MVFVHGVRIMFGLFVYHLNGRAMLSASSLMMLKEWQCAPKPSSLSIFLIDPKKQLSGQSDELSITRQASSSHNQSK